MNNQRINLDPCEARTKTEKFLMAVGAFSISVVAVLILDWLPELIRGV